MERLYKKQLPPSARIGESWEISDRPGDASVIKNGPLAGKSLRWLMERCPAELLGHLNPMPTVFPLLIKIIDAQDRLSLQVHPPAAVAAKLGGEPKTEMWVVTHAEPGAELYVGLKKGVTRAQFEKKIADQTVADCFHRIPVKAGDSVFLQSGRVHAIGANMMLFEVQQNSDTTYRVFDWNRVDDRGKLRELHVAQSLASIDFNDFEPKLLPDQFQRDGKGEIRPLVDDPLFKVAVRRLKAGETIDADSGRVEIFGVLEGNLKIKHGETAVSIDAGHFCLLPASLTGVRLQADAPVSFLEVR